MSVISNVHTAVVYDAKKSVPFEGQRLIVTIAKADAKGNYGLHLQQTMCTSVPVLTDSDIVDALNDDSLQGRLMPHLVEWAQKQQGALVASRIKAGTKTVTTEELSIAGLLNFLDADSTTDKWDAERVAGWFHSVMEAPVGIALLEKGLPEDKLVDTIKAWKKIFSESFGSRAAIPVAKAKQLDKALALAPEGDPIVGRFQARIDKILGVGLEEELGL